MPVSIITYRDKHIDSHIHRQRFGLTSSQRRTDTDKQRHTKCVMKSLNARLLTCLCWWQTGHYEKLFDETVWLFSIAPNFLDPLWFQDTCYPVVNFTNINKQHFCLNVIKYVGFFRRGQSPYVHYIVFLFGLYSNPL